MDAVDGSLPQLTALDVAQQLIAALVYLSVGVAALGQAPHDRRTQVFCAFAAITALTFGVTVFAWFVGLQKPIENRTFTGTSIALLGVGGLLLFHFSQVFPRRRPWIRGSGIQMPVAYALTPVTVAALARLWPADPAAVTPPFVILFVVFGFPLMVLLGFVLPVGAIVSFARSYQESPAGAARDPRPAIAGILVSQIAGGLLAILLAPVVTRVAPDSIAVKAVTTAVWGLSLLTPVAFAVGVWKHRLLEIDPLGGDVAAPPALDG
jgi:hypothetical protein